MQYEHRAAPALERMAVIDAFAKRIKGPHKVNLTEPQLTILVNLVKSELLCGAEPCPGVPASGGEGADEAQPALTVPCCLLLPQTPVRCR